MTGAYLRVNRDNKWHNIEIEYLTDRERRILLEDRALMWLNFVCKELVKVEELMEKGN